MPEIAAQFEAAGHTITDKWWKQENQPIDFQDPRNLEVLENRATADFMGVINADVLVVINSEMSEGKAVEMGIAISRFIPIILVGKRTNIFHFIPSVMPVKDVRAAIKALQVRAAFESQCR
jgi:hypothetical protein